MRDHSGTSARRELSPLVKDELATSALVAVSSDRMTDKEAARLLGEAASTQWSSLICTQYLSGKRALVA